MSRVSLHLIGAALNVCSLYMVPGSPAPLIKVCTSGDNLLLLYGDDRARLWDVKTLEFWRSMNTEKAKELLNQGGWAELSVPVYIVAVSVSFSLPWAGRYMIRHRREALIPHCLPLHLTRVCLTLFRSCSGRLICWHGSFDNTGGSRIVPLTGRIHREIPGRR